MEFSTSYRAHLVNLLHKQCTSSPGGFSLLPGTGLSLSMIFLLFAMHYSSWIIPPPLLLLLGIASAADRLSPLSYRRKPTNYPIND